MITEQRERLRRRAEGLLTFLEMNAPDNILAFQINALWRTAEATFGEELWKEFAAKNIAASRQSHGLCENCGVNHIPPQLSFHPQCEQCDAKLTTEVEDIIDEL